jgi:hypothetical protein
LVVGGDPDPWFSVREIWLRDVLEMAVCKKGLEKY